MLTVGTQLSDAVAGPSTSLWTVVDVEDLSAREDLVVGKRVPVTRETTWECVLLVPVPPSSPLVLAAVEPLTAVESPRRAALNVAISGLRPPPAVLVTLLSRLNKVNSYV